MCGRYAIFTEEENAEMREIINEVNERFRDTPSVIKTGEIFPTNTVPAITKDALGYRTVSLFKWGFPNFKFQSGVIINARSETLYEKPTFRRIIHTKRCLVPASAFYEWKVIENKKVKHQISLSDRKLFYMAGLYNSFKDGEGIESNSFVIITTAANEKMLDIHDRMPVILEKGMEDIWLNCSTDNLIYEKNLLKPYSNDLMHIKTA